MGQDVVSDPSAWQEGCLGAVDHPGDVCRPPIGQGLCQELDVGVEQCDGSVRGWIGPGPLALALAEHGDGAQGLRRSKAASIS